MSVNGTGVIIRAHGRTVVVDAPTFEGRDAKLYGDLTCQEEIEFPAKVFADTPFYMAEAGLASGNLALRITDSEGGVLYDESVTIDVGTLRAVQPASQPRSEVNVPTPVAADADVPADVPVETPGSEPVVADDDLDVAHVEAKPAARKVGVRKGAKDSGK